MSNRKIEWRWVLGFALVPFAAFFALIGAVLHGVSELWCWLVGHDWVHFQRTEPGGMFGAHTVHWDTCQRCGRIGQAGR